MEKIISTITLVCAACQWTLKATFAPGRTAIIPPSGSASGTAAPLMETPPPYREAPASGPRAAAPPLWDPDRPDIHRLLMDAEVIAHQLLPRGSNSTFLLQMTCGDDGDSLAVYKPQRGEAPLWDFPDGTLYLREYGSYLVSQALGWPAIPPMVLRSGPYGVGTVQLFIAHDPRAHYFTFGDQCVPELQRIALFDAVTNNADRKGGHCLQDPSGKIWSIDHGLTFHPAHKLRTVIWDFQGQPIPSDLAAGLRTLRERLSQAGDPLAAALSQLITPAELEAFRRRIAITLAKETFPRMGPYRNTPSPQV